MSSYYFSIAGFFFELNFHEIGLTSLKEKLQRELRKYLKQFLLSEKPQKIDYTIDIIGGKKLNYIYLKKNKRYYIELYRYQGKRRLTSYYRINIREFQIILMSIFLELLAKHEGFIVHTSACEIDKYAYIFPGKPDTGKSTIVRLLKRNYKILADDIGIIRRIDKKYYFYQTPILEKNALDQKQMDGYPIGGVFFLKKARYFKKTQIRRKNTVSNLMLDQFKNMDDILNVQTHNILKFVYNFSSCHYLFFAKNRKRLLRLFNKQTLV